MDAVKFTLSGKTAFFKKPDVNSYYYFSYGMIHKVAIMGILGAILGYNGYTQQKAATDRKGGPCYPEFYEKLRDLKMAIVPHYRMIGKKVQTFNNSVGYASKEQGGNLIVKEQWLEGPAWDIYIALNGEEGEKVADALCARHFVFLPYLGKNDHPADIFGVERVSGIRENPDAVRIDSLFPKGAFAPRAARRPSPGQAIDPIFKYEEKLPAGLTEETNQYLLKDYVYTNAELNRAGQEPIYLAEAGGDSTGSQHHIVWI